MVVAGIGDAGPPHYKMSQRGDALVDRAVAHVLAADDSGGQIRDFSPYGYDERQFCSPGFDLPVGCFSRTPHGEYPEYHSSADNLDFISPAALEHSYELLSKVVDVLEGNGRSHGDKPLRALR